MPDVDSVLIDSEDDLIHHRIPMGNAEFSIVPYGSGSHQLIPAEYSIKNSQWFAAEFSIETPSIDPVYDFYGAHLGQGAIMFTWKHDDHSLVSRYDLYASELSTGNYELIGSFLERHGILHGMPMGQNLYFRMVSIGKNDAVSPATQCLQGVFQNPDVNLKVTGISGSVIPSGSVFAVMDPATGAVNAVAAKQEIAIP